MKTPIEESYIQRHLALIDLSRVIRSLEYLAKSNDEYLRDALFRDAVVSYAKPFSSNSGIHTKNGLRINEKGVPPSLKATHQEIIGIRDELFAHMDLTRQQPHLDHYEINGEKRHSFMVSGYAKVYADHLVEPLKQLASSVHSYLVKELQEIEAKHF